MVFEFADQLLKSVHHMRTYITAHKDEHNIITDFRCSVDYSRAAVLREGDAEGLACNRLEGGPLLPSFLLLGVLPEGR